MEFIANEGALGAEIRGFDPAARATDDERAALLAAWRDHLVLFIRGHRLSDPDLLSFSRLFGELDPPGPNVYGEPFLPEYPEINVLSNVLEGGKPIGGLGAGEAVWHADMTYIDMPPKASVLHALEIPDSGGDTHFANMFAAYEVLPDAMKEAIAGRHAIHDGAHNSAGQLRRGFEDVDDVRLTPGAHHPLVRTEPDTGGKALFLGRRPHAYVIGMEVADSEALLDRLWSHADDPRFAVSHRWRVADTLIWNNLGILHRRDSFDGTARRIMHRTQIKGNERIS